MKKYIIILIILLGISYSQCDSLTILQCNVNSECEWIENLQMEDCYGMAWSEQNCEAIEGCTWWTSNYYAASNCSGQYQANNSYCEEIEMPECSELEIESNCNEAYDCEWIENVDLVTCSSLSYTICEEEPGCQNECAEYDSWYTWLCTEYHCIGDYYEIDNSYCEESDYILGDINQDYIINVMDVILVVNLILDDRYEILADLNQDQTINVIDIVSIIDIILQY
jgi:hypothetical protein